MHRKTHPRTPLQETTVEQYNIICNAVITGLTAASLAILRQNHERPVLKDYSVYYAYSVTITGNLISVNIPNLKLRGT